MSTGARPAVASPEGQPRPSIVLGHESADFCKLFLQATRDRYSVRAAKRATEIALMAAEAPPADLVVLGPTLAGADAAELGRTIRSDARTATIPVLLVSGPLDPKDEATIFDAGIADVIYLPASARLLLARMHNLIAARTRSRNLERLLLENTRQLRELRGQIARRLALAAQIRESGLSNRVLRVSHYVRILGESLGAADDVCETLFQAAPLYDIGKLGITEAILHKTDSLTASERDEMQRHTEYGARIIGNHSDPVLETARVMALTHHEHWDGSGYPEGLTGDLIPWPGRLMALADAFEAMTTEQYYRPAMDVPSSARAISKAAGTHFDPRVVEAFRKSLAKFIDIRNAFGDERKGMHDLDFSSPTAAELPVPDSPPTLRKPQASENTVRVRPARKATERGPAGKR